MDLDGSNLEKVRKPTMPVKTILLLGNPQLYQVSNPVLKEELGLMSEVVADLHDTLIDFRKRHGAGRAIAAPQIGVRKRLIYMHIDKPIVLLNPVLDQKSSEMMDVWDDCLCFPELFVKVRRNLKCSVKYRNLNWDEEAMLLESDLSELIQHETDHLDGILAVARAIDEKSFALKRELKGSS